MAERKTLIAVAVGGYIAFLGVFGYFAADVQYFPGEVDVSTWVQSWWTEWLDSVMKVVSTPGFVLVPLTVLASPILFVTGRWKEAVLLLATLLVASVLTFAVKSIVARPRPSAELVQILVNAEGRSFPSGHVLRFASFFGVVGLLSSWHMGPSIARIDHPRGARAGDRGDRPLQDLPGSPLAGRRCGRLRLRSSHRDGGRRSAAMVGGRGRREARE